MHICRGRHAVALTHFLLLVQTAVCIPTTHPPTLSESGADGLSAVFSALGVLGALSFNFMLFLCVGEG